MEASAVSDLSHIPPPGPPAPPPGPGPAGGACCPAPAERENSPAAPSASTKPVPEPPARGERRGAAVYAPGGYHWVPARGSPSPGIPSRPSRSGSPAPPRSPAPPAGSTPPKAGPVGRAGSLPAVPGFSVASGASEWQVVNSLDNSPQSCHRARPPSAAAPRQKKGAAPPAARPPSVSTPSSFHPHPLSPWGSTRCPLAGTTCRIWGLASG